MRNSDSLSYLMLCVLEQVFMVGRGGGGGGDDIGT